ncbi:hypothetical protein B0T18DRAFT_170852 [Schizothecium vesticola]|uniref:Uncharacterized protein n=1 Tax=Schizothecium vesticola TaxID=314040 RepID=A0AA40ENY7_9PEZI|nr:hypothetical protein B0T18DRAFT_170852 [Schizothecium vesticola]
MIRRPYTLALPAGPSSERHPKGSGGDGLRGSHRRWTKTLELARWVVSKQRQTAQPKSTRPLALWRDGREISVTQASPRGNLTWREAGEGQIALRLSTVYPRADMTMQAPAPVLLSSRNEPGPGNTAEIIPSLWGRPGRNGTHSEPSEFEHVRAHLPMVRPFSINSLWSGQVEMPSHLVRWAQPWFSHYESRIQDGTLVGHRHPRCRSSEPYRPFCPGEGLSELSPSAQLPSPILSILLAFVG